MRARGGGTGPPSPQRSAAGGTGELQSRSSPAILCEGRVRRPRLRQGGAPGLPCFGPGPVSGTRSCAGKGSGTRPRSLQPAPACWLPSRPVGSGASPRFFGQHQGLWRWVTWGCLSCRGLWAAQSARLKPAMASYAGSCLRACVTGPVQTPTSMFNFMGVLGLTEGRLS